MTVIIHKLRCRYFRQEKNWNEKITIMKSIPYIEFTKLESEQSGTGSKWYYMSHLSNACAAEDSHRTSAYAICLLSEGTLQLETDLFVQKAEAPAIFTIAPGRIRKFTDLGSEYDAKIFFFRKEIFMEGQADINFLDKLDFFEKTGQQVKSLSPDQFKEFQTLFRLIHKKSGENNLHTSAIIRSLIYIILYEIDEIHQEQIQETTSGTEAHNHILAQFKMLLAEHFIEERGVTFYAEKMFLTPKYFSTVIKEISGKTAGKWINEMILLESKVRLQNMENTVAGIAYDLNFSDPSHFGRFFKKHTGISPSEYRSGK